MSYLYLLVDQVGHGFKIGVSVDPLQRLSILPEKIDIAKSFQIKCGDKNAYRVEKMLHLLFLRYRLEKQKADGYTEWFSMECFEAVQGFIHSQRDLLDWTHFEQIQIKPEASNIPVTDELKEKRKAELLEIKKLKFLARQKENSDSVQALHTWLNMLESKQLVAGRFTADYYGEVHTHLALVNVDGIRSLPNSLYPFYIIKNGQVCGSTNILPSYMGNSALKYVFATFRALDHWIALAEGGQIVLDLIENIKPINEPQLSEVLLDYRHTVDLPFLKPADNQDLRKYVNN